jgi:hypothetical protein
MSHICQGDSILHNYPFTGQRAKWGPCFHPYRDTTFFHDKKVSCSWRQQVSVTHWQHWPLPDGTNITLLSYSIIYLLTHPMEQIPFSEANRFSVSQEIPSILWNLKAHYRIHKCPPPVPILSQLDSVHTPISHFPILILSSDAPGSPQWSLSLRLPHQNPVHASPLPHTRYMPRPSHSSWFYHSHNIGWAVQIIKFLIM